MTPKISICMPTYNFEQYLPEAIVSVLQQEFADFEFLIVDDHSTDRSFDVIEGFARKDARIRAIANSGNVGMVNNWNRCLALARGEYVKFLFGDDALGSAKALAEMTTVLDANPDVSLVASARTIIDYRSHPLRTVGSYEDGRVYRGTDVIVDCLVEQRNRIGEPSAVLFRRKQAARGFDARYRQLVDLELWCHLLEQGDFAYIDRPLVSFRVHERQQTSRNMLNPDLIDEPFLLLDEYGRKPYVRLSGAMRKFMHAMPAYAVWKLYRKHHRIGRKEALDLIRARHGLVSFFLSYPLFKLYKIYMQSFGGNRATAPRATGMVRPGSDRARSYRFPTGGRP